MINQLYKPFILYESIIILSHILLLLNGKGMSLGVIIAVSLISLFFCGIIIGLGVYGVKVFLDCLESAGVPLEIHSPELNWWGDYRIRIKSSAGWYQVESEISQFLSIRYNGPNTFGWKSFSLFEIRKAGRKEADKLLGFSKKDTDSPSA